MAKEEGVEIEKVLVWRRRPGQYLSNSPMVDGRDYFVDEVSATTCANWWRRCRCRQRRPFS